MCVPVVVSKAPSSSLGKSKLETSARYDLIVACIGQPTSWWNSHHFKGRAGSKYLTPAVLHKLHKFIKFINQQQGVCT
jgi:hypothetical protein